MTDSPKKKSVCPDVLSKPATKAECEDIKQYRRRILCRTHQIIKAEKLDFGTARRKAAEETKKACELTK